MTGRKKSGILHGKSFTVVPDRLLIFFDQLDTRFQSFFTLANVTNKHNPISFTLPEKIDFDLYGYTKVGLDPLDKRAYTPYFTPHQYVKTIDYLGITAKAGQASLEIVTCPYYTNILLPPVVHFDSVSPGSSLTRTFTFEPLYGIDFSYKIETSELNPVVSISPVTGVVSGTEQTILTITVTIPENHPPTSHFLGKIYMKGEGIRVRTTSILLETGESLSVERTNLPLRGFSTFAQSVRSLRGSGSKSRTSSSHSRQSMDTSSMNTSASFSFSLSHSLSSMSSRALDLTSLTSEFSTARDSTQMSSSFVDSISGESEHKHKSGSGHHRKHRHSLDRKRHRTREKSDTTDKPRKSKKTDSSQKKASATLSTDSASTLISALTGSKTNSSFSISETRTTETDPTSFSTDLSSLSTTDIDSAISSTLGRSDRLTSKYSLRTPTSSFILSTLPSTFTSSSTQSDTLDIPTQTSATSDDSMVGGSSFTTPLESSSSSEKGLQSTTTDPSMPLSSSLSRSPRSITRSSLSASSSGIASSLSRFSTPTLTTTTSGTASSSIKTLPLSFTSSGTTLPTFSRKSRFSSSDHSHLTSTRTSNQTDLSSSSSWSTSNAPSSSLHVSSTEQTQSSLSTFPSTYTSSSSSSLTTSNQPVTIHASQLSDFASLPSFLPAPLDPASIMESFTRQFESDETPEAIPPHKLQNVSTSSPIHQLIHILFTQNATVKKQKAENEVVIGAPTIEWKPRIYKHKEAPEPVDVPKNDQVRVVSIDAFILSRLVLPEGQQKPYPVPLRNYDLLAHGCLVIPSSRVIIFQNHPHISSRTHLQRIIARYSKEFFTMSEEELSGERMKKGMPGQLVGFWFRSEDDFLRVFGGLVSFIPFSNLFVS